MASSTKPGLTAAASVALGDILSARQGADTRDKKVTVQQILNALGLLAAAGALDPADLVAVTQTGVAKSLALDDLRTALQDGGALELDVTGLTGAGGVSGDVVGPASSTDNTIARFDGGTGKLLQNSAALVDDSGNITAGAAAAGWIASSPRAIQVVEDVDVFLATSGATYHNSGAGAGFTCTLPEATRRMKFAFAVLAAQNLVVQALGSDVIRVGGAGSSAGGTFTSNQAGAFLYLESLVNGEWIGMLAGSWTPA